MTYEEIVSVIENKRRFESKSGFEVSTELLQKLLPAGPKAGTIHIAGTNGKGSTAVFVSEILQAAGFCVGLLTSPHLVTFRERIRVDREMIKKEDVVRLGEKVLSVPLSCNPTMFDLSLAMALLYFEEKNCDYVILETGLGGRLDSTRAVQRIPDVTVITAIGFDHEAILGDTIEQIAGEKAGVIREKTRVVIARMDAKAQKVIRDACEKKGVLYRYGEEADLSEYLSKEDHLGLLGAYQKENAENAVMAVKLLEKKEIDGEAIRRGLTKARWPGRMDVISEDPFILADGAHNPQGVEALRTSLLSLYPQERFIYVFGVMADKDYEHMLLSMIGTEEMFFTVTVEDARAEKSERIAEFLKDKGGRATACQSISEAFIKAAHLQEITGEKIVAFGSLYFIGEVMRWIKKEEIQDELSIR